MTVAAALEVSSNPVAVRTLQNLGVKNSFQFMEEKFHIDLEDGRTVNGQVMNDLGASQLALGGLTDGVTTRDMANAFATFPSGGVYREARTYTGWRTARATCFWTTPARRSPCSRRAPSTI